MDNLTLKFLQMGGDYFPRAASDPTIRWFSKHVSIAFVLSTHVEKDSIFLAHQIVGHCIEGPHLVPVLSRSPE